jgi:drug/metabolite transporter (DMT)-like permease
MSGARTSPVVLLLLASVSWGLATALTKVALEQLAPLDLFGIEVAVGAAVLGAVALGRGARPSRPSAVALALGVLDPGLAFLLFDVGLAHTAATHGALLLATDSLFTVALAAVLLRERVGPRLGVALAAGFAGSALLSLKGGGMSTVAGDMLVVASALSAAVYGVLARRIAARRDALSLTAEQMLGATSVALPLAVAAMLAGHSHLGHVDTGHLVVALAVSLLGSVVPFVLYNVAIEAVTASSAALVLTLVPLFGALASLALLSEDLAGPQLAGGAFVLVAAGLATIDAGAAPAAGCPA